MHIYYVKRLFKMLLPMFLSRYCPDSCSQVMGFHTKLYLNWWNHFLTFGQICWSETRAITSVKVMWRNKAYLISTLISMLIWRNNAYLISTFIFMLRRRNIPYLLSIRKENVHIAACATPFKFLRKNDKNSVLKQNTALKHFWDGVLCLFSFPFFQLFLLFFICEIVFSS